MNFKLAAVAAAVAATLALAACGGGGDNGGAFAPIGNIVPPAPPAPPAPPPPPPPPPAPAPAPAPATTTFLYEKLPIPADAAGLLSDLNAEGAKGFMFLSELGAGGSIGAVYVKMSDATYVYELKTPPADAGAFLAQANEAGGRGFRWVGALSTSGTSSVMLYRKDSDAGATYTYRSEASATDKASFLAQVNAQGAAGYFNTAPGYIFGGDNIAVFEKSSAGSATYAYEVGDTAADTSAALAQFEEKGARGYRYRYPYFFGSVSGSVFVKDLSQSSTFNYQALPGEATLDAEIAQSNTVGAAGYGFVGPLFVGAEPRNYYYKPSNCTGVVICKPTNPFGL